MLQESDGEMNGKQRREMEWRGKHRIYRHINEYIRRSGANADDARKEELRCLHDGPSGNEAREPKAFCAVEAVRGPREAPLESLEKRVDAALKSRQRIRE